MTNWAMICTPENCVHHAVCADFARHVAAAAAVSPAAEARALQTALCVWRAVHPHWPRPDADMRKVVAELVARDCAPAAANFLGLMGVSADDLAQWLLAPVL